jgi:hypothetical protein
MQKGIKGAAIIAAIVSFGFSTIAQAKCWTSEAVDAAKVRDLETMLMVSSLRCRLGGHDFLSEYNAFVRSSRPALTEVNNALRTHFEGAGGLNAYDRYVTGIANRYGGGADGLGCKDMRSILRAAKAEGNSFTGLVRLANDADVRPRVPGQQCASRIASRR